MIGLLEHWNDFFELADSRVGIAGAVDPDKPMPENWTILSSMSRHPSVLELIRLLKGLREQGPAHYRAVLAFFDAPWRTVDTTIRRRNAHGKMVDAPLRVRQRVLPPMLRRYPLCRDRFCECVLPRPVCTAIDVLASGWDPVVPLELPYALLAKLRPLADSDGWTEAAA